MEKTITVDVEGYLEEGTNLEEFLKESYLTAEGIKDGMADGGLAEKEFKSSNAFGVFVELKVTIKEL